MRKCPTCGADPTPALLPNGMVVRPCGKIRTEYLIPDGCTITCCSMGQWQKGYLDALKDQQKKPVLPKGEGG